MMRSGKSPGAPSGFVLKLPGGIAIRRIPLFPQNQFALRLLKSLRCGEELEQSQSVFIIGG
jgi:hypothetical protein